LIKRNFGDGRFCNMSDIAASETSNIENIPLTERTNMRTPARKLARLPRDFRRIRLELAREPGILPAAAATAMN
jgi:hypothetical protein